MEKYEDLELDDLFNLAVEYNNYIQDFDYEKSGTPVSVYEFYECEYQEIIAEDDSDIGEDNES